MARSWMIREAMLRAMRLRPVIGHSETCAYRCQTFRPQRRRVSSSMRNLSIGSSAIFDLSKEFDVASLAMR